uniref:MIF4G-like type 2 domain-containing protein n=1 Tax=Aegilops tauschii subsp. strangulata TaxID=200361 RepID=A0A453I453_AEGTS
MVFTSFVKFSIHLALAGVGQCEGPTKMGSTTCFCPRSTRKGNSVVLFRENQAESIEDAAELEGLLPPKAGPNFRYHTDESKESTEGHRISKELVSMVRGRKTTRDIILWVEEQIVPANGTKFAVDVVSQTLLDIGSKSFTHLITVLERYGQIISKLCPDEEMQLLLMDEVSAYWKNSTQMTAIAIDRMMGYRLISNLAIVKWVFSPANVDQFHVSDRPWE